MEAQTQHPVWKLWLNPILRRYCRSRLRPRAIGMVLLIDILIAGFLVAMATSIGGQIDFDLADKARTAVVPLLVFQGIILFALGTTQASGGMIAERDEGVIDYQRLAPMTPLAKTLGYLFGLPIREYVMFVGTLPFSIWAIWAGEVPLHIWVPLYVVLMSSAVLYHLTGLVTGTVVRNRRIGFLFSIGVVFCLYTIIPQAAKFGLVFFDYLTIRPVVKESAAGIAPDDIGHAIQLAQSIAPRAKFFNLNFSEMIFTLFTQAGLMLTFLAMLCRKWRSDERHLLNKVWAGSLFIWIQILLLGNALPLIKPGLLFPSRGASSFLQQFSWSPRIEEALAMSALFGLVILVLILLLTLIITPSIDRQKKARRHACKHGIHQLPVTSDPASSWFFVFAMAMIGGLSWFIFSRSLFDSHWFNKSVSWTVAVHFVGVLLAGSLLFQTLLEGKGGRSLALTGIFVGIVPLMIGAVIATVSGGFSQLAIWTFAMSPLCMPAYASISLLPIEPSETASREFASIQAAFHIWLILGVVSVAYLSLRLRKHHRTLAQRAAESTAEINPSPDVEATSEASAPQ